MKTTEKRAVAVSNEIPAKQQLQKNNETMKEFKPGHVPNEAAENLGIDMENQSLIKVKKKLSVTEKLDLIQSFDAIHGRYDYLTKKKKELDQFGNSQNGFTGSYLMLEDSEDHEVKISNPTIVEELVKIAKMRLQGMIVTTEKEIEAFEI